MKHKASYYLLAFNTNSAKLITQHVICLAKSRRQARCFVKSKYKNIRTIQLIHKVPMLNASVYAE